MSRKQLFTRHFDFETAKILVIFLRNKLLFQFYCSPRISDYSRVANTKCPVFDTHWIARVRVPAGIFV
jgi:hypothetical protein